MKKILNRVNEAGTMLVEAMAMLGLIAMVTPILYKKAAERTTELQDINASNQLRILADAMDSYIKDNFTRITEGETVVNSCNVGTVDYSAFGGAADASNAASVTFDISHLCEYLPYGFLKNNKTQDSKLFASSESDPASFQVVLRKTTGTETDDEGNEVVVAETVTGFLTAVPNEGEDFPSTRVARIATMVGSNGGYVEEDGEIMGAQGIWSLQNDSELGLTLPAKTFVISSLQPISSQGLANEDVLHRKTERQNDYVLNSMETDLFMSYADKNHNIRQVNQIIMKPQLEWMVGGDENDFVRQTDDKPTLEYGSDTYEANLDYTLYIDDKGGAFMEGNLAALASLFTVRSEENGADDGGIKYYGTATETTENPADPSNPTVTTTKGDPVFSVTTSKMEYGNINEDTAGALLTVDKENTSMEFESKTESTDAATGETSMGTQKLIAANATRVNVMDGALSVRNPGNSPDGGKYDSNHTAPWVRGNATPSVIVGGGEAYKGSYTTYNYTEEGKPEIADGEFVSENIEAEASEHALTVNGPAFIKDSLRTAHIKAYNVDASKLRAGVPPENFDAATDDEDFYLIAEQKETVGADGAATGETEGRVLIGHYTDAASGQTRYRMQIAEAQGTAPDGTDIQPGVRVNHENGINILASDIDGAIDTGLVGHPLDASNRVDHTADSDDMLYDINTDDGQIKIGATNAISLATVDTTGAFINNSVVSIQNDILRAYSSDYFGAEGGAGSFLDSVADNIRFVSQNYLDALSTDDAYAHDTLYHRVINDTDSNGHFGLGGMDFSISEAKMADADFANPVMDIKAKREEDYISSRFAGGFAIYDHDVTMTDYPDDPSLTADTTDGAGNPLSVGMGNPALYVNKGDFQILTTVASTEAGTDAGDIILQVDNNETHDAVTTTNGVITTTTDERGSVYIRRGAINIDSAGDTRWANSDIAEDYVTPEESIGYIAADRFIAQTKPEENALNATSRNLSGGITGTITSYDRYEVNPAYTSVMHDIKLTTRGGARLSDILPDFINKGIYVVDNTYDEGTTNWVNATTIPATDLGEGASAEAFTSPYLGFVPTPTCPQGYSKVITINPSGWSMAQAGTPVNNGGSIDISTHNNPYLYWYTQEGKLRTEVEEVEPVNPLTFQKSTWLRAMVMPYCEGTDGGNKKFQLNGKCGDGTTFSGWGAVMGFIYPHAYYKEFVDGTVGGGHGVDTGKTGTANTGDTEDTTVADNGTVYWNLYPVQYRQLEAYATVYCYFNRTNPDGSAMYPEDVVDSTYDQLKSQREYWEKDNTKGYVDRLNDPSLKYDDPW